MISLRAHNVTDYFIGAFLLVAPWLFRFSAIDAARNTFLILGAGLIAYSLLTNYYYAAVHAIPLGAHMTLDAMLGVILILSPALLGYREVLSEGQYAAHIVLGIGTIGLVALTRPRSEAAKTPAEKVAIQHDLPLPH